MFQALLANPVFATVLDQRLEGTGWTAELIANFLYNGPPEDRPPGMPTYDWRDVYQATDRILTFLSKFLSVSLFLSLDREMDLRLGFAY